MIPSLLYNDIYTNNKKLAENHETLILDLNLSQIFNAMAEGDQFIFNAAKEVLLSKQKITINTILFRQENLADSLHNKAGFLNLYNSLSSCIEAYQIYKNKSLPAFSKFVAVSTRIKDSITLFEILLVCIHTINELIDKNGILFLSSGVRSYFEAFGDFFSKAFLTNAQEQIDKIKSALDNSTIRLSAGLGAGLKGNNYIIRDIQHKSIKKVVATKNQFNLTSIGIQAQANSLRDAGMLKVVHILNEVNDKILEYLKSFQYDIGFYIGCINLYQSLVNIGVPVSFPEPMDQQNRKLAFCELVDISMALENSNCPVGNSIESDEIKLMIVTGANQGGKSTFLRSVGCAQLMMQCGMFVSANSFKANCCSNIFTHFCRSESGEMYQGRLNEELYRMNEIINLLDTDSLILMNESFSSTSEREASSIAQEIIRALYDMNIKTIYVTHFYDFAKKMEEKKLKGTVFLVAQRNTDGTRPFILKPSSPNQTSFGLDIYNEIFGDE